MQHHLYQQTPQQQHYQYSYYPANNSTALHPPPPPPPQQPHQITRGYPINTNANVAASLRNNLHSHNNDSKAPKKVNPKMAKKYAGRGLKTITISGPGLPTQKFKICVGSHPDDIKKWIEERRKRFPRRDGSHRVGAAGEKRRRQEEGEQNNMARKRTCLDDNNNKTKTGDADGKGTQTGGLSSLLAGYDSSSSQDEGEISEKQNEDKTTPLEGGDNAKAPKRLCTYYQRGKCRHGTSCKFLHSESATAAAKDPNQRHKQRELQSARDKARNQYERELQILGLASPSGNANGKNVTSNTSLLHKLLQRDKERERRLTLQLLRYIVDNECFRGGDPSGDKTCNGQDEDNNKEQE